MNRFWSKTVHNLIPYIPGEQPKVANLIKLNTNENPYGPSPLVLEALKKEASDTLRLYPDPNADGLKAAVADYYRISPKQVFVGNGSDEVLAHTFLGLLKHPNPILFPDITYSFFPVYCGLYDIGFKTIPLTDTFDIDLMDYRKPNGGIIFPNPNAPTGILLPLSNIVALLEYNRESVVVIDEAYIDFGGETAVKLVDRFHNLLVIQTLSKSRALAGLRVGFAMGNPDLIEALERIKNSFNSYPLDRLAIAGAMAAMEDKIYFEKTRGKIISGRQDLMENLTRMGFEVLPSSANFVFARHPMMDAGIIFSKLREKSILVRRFDIARIEQFMRISVGSEQDMAILCQTLERILNTGI